MPRIEVDNTYGLYEVSEVDGRSVSPKEIASDEFYTVPVTVFTPEEIKSIDFGTNRETETALTRALMLRTGSLVATMVFSTGPATPLQFRVRFSVINLELPGYAGLAERYNEGRNDPSHFMQEYMLKGTANKDDSKREREPRHPFYTPIGRSGRDITGLSAYRGGVRRRGKLYQLGDGTVEDAAKNLLTTAATVEVRHELLTRHKIDFKEVIPESQDGPARALNLFRVINELSRAQADVNQNSNVVEIYVDEVISRTWLLLNPDKSLSEMTESDRAEIRYPLLKFAGKHGEIYGYYGPTLFSHIETDPEVFSPTDSFNAEQKLLDDILGGELNPHSVAIVTTPIAHQILEILINFYEVEDKVETKDIRTKLNDKGFQFGNLDFSRALKFLGDEDSLTQSVIKKEPHSRRIQIIRKPTRVLAIESSQFNNIMKALESLREGSMTESDLPDYTKARRALYKWLNENGETAFTIEDARNIWKSVFGASPDNDRIRTWIIRSSMFAQNGQGLSERISLNKEQKAVIAQIGNIFEKMQARIAHWQTDRGAIEFANALREFDDEGNRIPTEELLRNKLRRGLIEKAGYLYNNEANGRQYS